MSLAGNEKLYSAPERDELELSVFGPGIGEAILLHVGENIWICVDCAKLGEEAWPLKYLKEIGARPNDCIQLVVATHWHSDHVDGLNQVIGECPRAIFACSQALQAAEFKHILARFDDEVNEKMTSPLAELRTIFHVYASRRKNNANYPAPRLTKHGNILFDRELEHSGRIQVLALSPSDEDYLASLDEIVSLTLPLDRFLPGSRLYLRTKHR